MIKKTLVRTWLLAAGVLGLTASALAQTYPARPIKVVVPYAAGGSTDQMARVIQQPLSEILGQPVIIDNRAGAGGAIGTEAVVRAEPDGYTLVFGNTGPNAVGSLMRKLPYDVLTDLKPISTVAITPMMLAVPSNTPANNVKEFLALARANPGKFNYGSVGPGSLSHLTGEYFNELAGVQLQHIPYKGGAPMLTAFLGGEIQAAFVTGLDGGAMLATGRVKYLAVGTAQPTPVVEGLPTVAKDVPGFQTSAWFGLLAPKGTPDAIVARLNAAVAQALSRPDVRQFFVSRHVEPKGSTPQELTQIIRAELEQWRPIVVKHKIEL
ncbi:Bug family tripartite tricarboxylate transporter substrate binding protein [Hydrogenophaga sp. NFH-34]|uniref:Bug family tripartite tricarboxylate transporter substrate binding protein n=1 Tax=Hydrogenophaga sp. NFH-34 TaxID=2744446 RepID=UPI001F43FB54|nr:tripartite tricarboxylate transporter substrate binding protein [Hydrogenophaga sp. NFH-34]